MPIASDRNLLLHTVLPLTFRAVFQCRTSRSRSTSFPTALAALDVAGQPLPKARPIALNTESLVGVKRQPYSGGSYLLQVDVKLAHSAGNCL